MHSRLLRHARTRCTMLQINRAWFYGAQEHLIDQLQSHRSDASDSSGMLAAADALVAIARPHVVLLGRS